MIKKLTYKQKFFISLKAVLLGYIIIYSVVIKDTVHLFRDNKLLEADLTLIKDAPQRILKIEKRLHTLNSIIRVESSNGNQNHEKLHAFVSKYCYRNQLTLAEYPETHVNYQQGYTIETSVLVVQGGFHKLLRLIHSLEHEYTAGKVISVDFFTEKNFREKRKKLYVKVLIQTIKSFENE